MATIVFNIIVIVILFGFLLERTLSWLNASMRSTTLPDELNGIYDEEKYRKSQEYEREKSKFGFYTSTFSLVLMLVMLFAGGFAFVDELTRSVTTNPVWMALMFFGILGLASDILGTPFSLYDTFVIEEKYGFNKTTIKTFITDKLKGYVLGAIIGGALLSLLIWLINTAGQFFWIYAWVAFSGFTLLMTMFYSSVIVPLFNKLTPLPEGELRTAIEEYSKSVNFPLDDIYVMDGSKRSTKANAFFSGLGAKKRIVLFDTLIEKHTTEELVAVLAHEVGHFKRKHTTSAMILSVLQTGLMLAILSLFINNPVLSHALGAEEHSIHMGLLSFSLLYSPLSILLGIGMNVLSRKNEYEADYFAATTYNANALKIALKKLSVDNLSNLRPHPAYVYVYYSHPPLLKRLGALSSN